MRGSLSACVHGSGGGWLGPMARSACSTAASLAPSGSSTLAALRCGSSQMYLMDGGSLRNESVWKCINDNIYSLEVFLMTIYRV